MPYTEEKYENAIIQLFEEMGYTHAYGPDIDRDYKIPLYIDELTAALYRLNPTLPDDAISDALFKLQNFENGELVLAAVDAPTNAGSGALMQPSAHGLALLQLASEFKTPVTVFSTLLDQNTGRRTLRIEQVCGGGSTISVEELTARVFAHLELLMRRDTAAWHLWSEAERALVR